MELLALFKNIDSAVKGMDELLRKKIPEENISSLSPFHMPNGTMVRTKDNGWYKKISVAGAVIGALFGFTLAVGTALLYPLFTGDKPIIAPYPVGIITYEFLMLGAILGNFIGMILEIKKKRKKFSLYDPAISDGMIGISVIGLTESQSSLITKALKKSGAQKIISEENK